MGCDIHMHIEMQGAGDVWVRAEDVVDNPHYPQWGGEKRIYENWYRGRSYEDFSKLAGVRGVGPPIIEPRGVPDDISESTRQSWEIWDGGAHTPHYYTLAEIVHVQPQFRHSDGYKSEMETLIDKMKKVANDELHGDYGKIRMVFWFDS